MFGSALVAAPAVQASNATGGCDATRISARYSKASCPSSAPGTQFRLNLVCVYDNGTYEIRHGNWVNQKGSKKAYSKCPANTRVADLNVPFG